MRGSSLRGATRSARMDHGSAFEQLGRGTLRQVTAGTARPARVLAGFGHAADSRSTGDAFHPALADAPSSPGRDIIGCLWRRRRLVALVSAIAMAVLGTALVLVPNSYQASASVIFEGDRPSVVRGDEAVREPAFGPDTLANEVERVLAEEALGAVVTRLSLMQDPEFAARPPGGQAGTDRDRALAETVATLRSHLTVGPVGQSRVLRITAWARDPLTAARIANTVATTYTEALASAKEAAIAEAHRWFEQRVAELRDRATRSALAYEEARQASGLVRGKDGTVTQEQITQVSAELTKAQQLRTAAELALSQLASTPLADVDQLNSAAGSPLLAKLREQLAVAAARLAEREATGGPSNPGVVASRAEVAAITRSINQQRERTRQALRTQAAVASATEQRLGAMLLDLKARSQASEAGNARAQALERAASADRDLYTSFLARSRQTDPDTAYRSASAQVLSRASIPFRPSAPNRRVLLPAALVLSLGLGAVAGLVREGTRRGIRSLRDLPVGPELRLGLLPQVPRGDRRMAHAFDEAAARLLERVLLPEGGAPPASVVVTSALPDEGKTETAIALARAAGDRGLRVLLVDGDMRTRGLSAAAGLLDCDRHLVRLLRDGIQAGEAAVHSQDWGVATLPAGDAGGSPVHLLATGAWDLALRELQGNYDLVVVDAPPALVVGDAGLLGRPADATVVVARWGSTPLPAVQLAFEQLAAARAQVAGVVLTMVPAREHASLDGDDSVVFSSKALRYHGQGRLG